MNTTPGGAKKITLLSRMQVAIPFADQSKLFSMNVLRKAPLGLKPSALRDPGTLCPDSDSSVVQAAGHFSFFGDQVFARDSARRSRLCVHPASVPLR